MDTDESNSDDDGAWDASQVPSTTCIAPPILSSSSKPQPHKQNTMHSKQLQLPPKPATKNIPLTTIFKTKVQGTTKRKRASQTAKHPANAPKTTTPLFPLSPPPPNNTALPIIKSVQQDIEPPTCTTTRMFMDRADMLDVLAHRKQLLDLCARALNILVYPANEFRNGMRFSHCVFAVGPLTNIDDFLAARLFQIGDDLNCLFVLVWHERDILQQTHITCMVDVYAQCAPLAMDVLQFSMCVSKRLVC